MITVRAMTMMTMMIAMIIRTNKMKMKTQIRKSTKENLQASLIIKNIKKIQHNRKIKSGIRILEKHENHKIKKQRIKRRAIPTKVCSKRRKFIADDTTNN